MEPVLQQTSDPVCLDDELQDRSASKILDQAESTEVAEPICDFPSPAVSPSNVENDVSSSNDANDTSNSEQGRVDADNTLLQLSDNSDTVAENT